MSNLVLAALWRTSQPTHHHSESRITVIKHQLFSRTDKGLLLRDNFNGLWLTAKCASYNRGRGGVEGPEREGGGATAAQSLLAIMMTANEGMSGIISLDHSEKEAAHEPQSETLNNGNPSLSMWISDANNSWMDGKSAEHFTIKHWENIAMELHSVNNTLSRRQKDPLQLVWHRSVKEGVNCHNLGKQVWPHCPAVPRCKPKYEGQHLPN